MKRFVVPIVMMLAAPVAHEASGEPVVVRGRVFGGLVPSPFASVVVPGTRRGLQTDECGRFMVRLEAGTGCSLMVAAVGYYHRMIEIPAGFDASRPLVLQLDPVPVHESWGEPTSGGAWFASSYFQADHAPPRGSVVFCGNSFDETAAEVATCTRPEGRLELRDRADGSLLHVAWRVPESDRASLLVQSLPERKTLYVLARRVWRTGDVKWDGHLDDGGVVPPGAYRLSFDVLSDSLSLRFGRVARRVPLVVLPSYDSPACK